MGAKIQCNYDQMNQIGQAFERQASLMDELQKRVMQTVGQLQGGHWVGIGANNFYSEMQNLVVPAMNRLKNALREGSNTSKKIGQIFRQAEQEASQQFNFLDALRAALGATLAGGIAGVVGAATGAGSLASRFLSALTSPTGAKVAAGIFKFAGTKGFEFLLQKLAPNSSLLAPATKFANSIFSMAGLSERASSFLGNLGKVGVGVSKASAIGGAIFGVGAAFLEAAITGEFDGAKLAGKSTAAVASAALNYATGGIYGLVDIAATGIGAGANKLGQVITNNADFLANGDPTRRGLANFAGQLLQEGGQSLAPTANIEKIATNLFRGDFRGAGKAFVDMQLAVPKVVAGGAIAAGLAVDRFVITPAVGAVKSGARAVANAASSAFSRLGSALGF